MNLEKARLPAGAGNRAASTKVSLNIRDSTEWLEYATLVKTSQFTGTSTAPSEQTDGRGRMRLLGKVAVVTGSAVGLGRAVATRFAREGAIVVTADTNTQDGSAVVEQIRREGGSGTFLRTDIADEFEVKTLLDAASAEFGRIDILYNNAAVLLYDHDARAHEVSLETWDRTMNVNLRGTFLCCQHVIPFMLKQGGGSIINMGSPTGLSGCAPNLTAYSTSKAAIFGLTRVMAAGYARDRIRVNTVIPGTMDTPMNEVLLMDDEKREQYREAVPMGRLGVPSDIEGIAVFLASDESSYCTGGLYTCDGGLTVV
jgi:NAD(P)-dependent dehydrogenase (short-subunit alcohol dehydrogenase family)